MVLNLENLKVEFGDITTCPIDPSKSYLLICNADKVGKVAITVLLRKLHEMGCPTQSLAITCVGPPNEAVAFYKLVPWPKEKVESA